MKNLLNQVLSGEITGFNLFSKELNDDRQAVIYGHTEKAHLSLLFKELKKCGLLTKHSIVKRESVYLWDSSWIPSSNTQIVSIDRKEIAVESGYLVRFFPKGKGIAKSLIEFLTNRCWSRKKFCIAGSWDVPYLGVGAGGIKHPEFISSKELLLKGDDGTIQSSFVPDKFKTGLAKIWEKFLFRPFAEFVGA